MNIRQMEVFWAVMRTGTVTGAAKFLGVSQPAVSKMLRHAEDVIGMPLFARRGGKLYPTPEAEDLFEIAESVFENVDQMQRAVRTMRRGHHGRVQVAALPSLATTLLLRPTSNFLLHRPHVNFTVRMLPTHDIVSHVMHNQVDLGVLWGPLPDASVGFIDIGEADVICGVHGRSELAREDTITPQLVRSERLISFPLASAWTARAVTAFEDADVPYRVAVECSHPTIALSLVEAGVGVALLPGPFSDVPHYPNVVLKRFSPSVSVRLLAIHKHERLTRLAASFIAEIQACSSAADLRV